MRLSHSLLSFTIACDSIYSCIIAQLILQSYFMQKIPHHEINYDYGMVTKFISPNLYAMEHPHLLYHKRNGRCGNLLLVVLKEHTQRHSKHSSLCQTRHKLSRISH